MKRAWTIADQMEEGQICYYICTSESIYECSVEAKVGLHKAMIIGSERVNLAV